VGIVTGGNSGIGWETVRVLAANGAKVILACRSESRGQDGIDRVKALQPQAALEFLKLDLADLESVKEAAAAFNGKYDRLRFADKQCRPDGHARKEDRSGF
jgi:NAD(P)-dependent dehydrogenase (short-subunit alcohol dehydrogenase family)